VRSIAFGRVAWSGRMRGFGTTVVLDHASGWYSVYAGMSSLEVIPGQVVREGDILGKVERTPGDPGVRLYFELRSGDTAVDPLPYLERAQ
jgi:murein DD-endopeptidase MepM/ murein hydrolase activator NlpD